MRRAGPRFPVAAATLVLSIVVLVVFAAGLWQVVESRRTVTQDVLKENLARAQLAGQVVRADMQGRLDLSEAITRRSSLIEAVGRGEWTRAGANLREFQLIRSDISSATLLDATGHLRARDPIDPFLAGQDFSGRDFFKGAIASQSAYLSNAYVQDGTPGTVVVAISSAIRYPLGTPVGVLVTTVPISTLDRLVSSIRLPGGGSLEIFDGAGHALTGPEAGLKDSFDAQPAVSNALAGRTGVGQLAVPGLPGPRLTAYSPVGDLGWAVLSEQPRSTAYRAETALTTRLKQISIIGALVVLLGAAIVVGLLHRISRERNRSTAILNSMADGAVITDLTGHIVAVNPAMERLAGWPENAVAGRPVDFYKLVDARGDRLEQERHAFQETHAAPEPDSMSVFGMALLTKNGRRVPIHVTVAPLLDHSGATVGRVAIVRDVSNEWELDQLRTSLISTLSRELRSPLTMIHGFSELLLTRDLNGDDSREALDQINSSAGRLARTVGDMVSVLRIESGKVVMKRSRVDLARVLNEVIVPYAGERKIKVDLNGGVPPVLADRDMLAQVLANLVSNAVKFSSPGAQVSVGAKPNGSSVEVYVEDHGIGVSEQERAQLFQKFGRVDRPEVQEAGGTGLGLYIAKNLVEMQGGMIWVRSEPGRGSTFGFSVPLAETKESAPKPS